ncbi:ABC transporter permease [Xanthovirga aplysinae]|uniref:ABC transporter permease n=1 Tax=Xanthovirga aplysinae TaxID=2529853 RepID=UPI0012BBEA7D|nr:ABC transporter permease [Xanthovirga aplysinae]MTI31622.1 ABC transporter permease [Xanthovirga aplysinae]
MLRYLLEKEFKQFWRSKAMIRTVLFLPFTSLIIYPLVASFDIRNVKLSIVDNDKGMYSQQLIEKARSSGYFRITDVSGNYRQALKSIESNKADIILEIPLNFERELVRNGQADLMVSANAVNGNKGGLGTAYLNQIISDFNTGIRTRLQQNPDEPIIPSMEILPLYRYNPSLDYKVFMIPALIIMMLTQMIGFLPAMNIVGEKERGTIEQMNVTSVKKFTFILAKLIPFWVAGYLVLTIGILIAFFLWKLVPVGFIGTIFIFASIFILAFSGFGLVISNYASTVQQAMFMMFFFVMTFIFMSGLYTPVANMPEAAQWFSNLSPLKYIIEVLRLIYLKGSSFLQLLPQFLALCGFAIFFNTWAVLSYKKSD